MRLSGAARRALHEVERRLRGQPALDKPRSAKWVKEVEAWCEQQDIDLRSRLSVKTLRFDRDLLSQMNDVLESHGQAPLGVSLSGLTTSEQAVLGNEEAKGVRERPRSRRVLVNLPVDSSLSWLSDESRQYRDLDWPSIDLRVFDALIEIENLDSFYAFSGDTEANASRATIASHTYRPLVVYRGDKHYGEGFADLARAWSATGKPHGYLGDFDASGVSLALSGHSTHLILPPLDWLVANVIGEHLPPGQLETQAGLRRHLERLGRYHPLPSYLALILDKQRGLRQQWFGADLEWIPLHP
jgi:hypothetical protein